MTVTVTDDEAEASFVAKADAADNYSRALVLRRLISDAVWSRTGRSGGLWLAAIAIESCTMYPGLERSVAVNTSLVCGASQLRR